jgi:hypothetical protein
MWRVLTQSAPSRSTKVAVTNLLSPMESATPHTAVKGEEFKIEVYLNILDMRAMPAIATMTPRTRVNRPDNENARC